MQALQTLSQREFEMMQCFWEADEPLKMKELQTRWAHGETPQSRSTTLIYVKRLVEMKYLYKTVEQKRQVLYHPIVPCISERLEFIGYYACNLMERRERR